MSNSRASLAGLIDDAGIELREISTQLKTCVASADDLMECSAMVFALADALKLYAEKMPKGEPDGSHSLRQHPPSS